MRMHPPDADRQPPSATAWKTGFRQCMAWLHGWSGLVVGWVLYFVFLTGTCGYLHYEIDRWMQPELPLAAPRADPPDALRLAQARLAQAAPQAAQWTILLPGPRGNDGLRILWRTAPGAVPATELLDTGTGMPLDARPRATGGGRELYVMHWRLRYLPETAAIWIVGICSMLMLVAIVTGVIAHKKIFREFFTFRPGKGQRSWLDIHNVLSVLALPYHLMITYSGLVFFLLVYMPWGVQAAYGTHADAARRFSAEAFAHAAPAARAARPAGQGQALAPLEPMLRDAQRRWGADGVQRVSIDRRSDAAPQITFYRDIGGRLSRARDQLRFDGGSGRLLYASPESTTASADFHQLLLGLHEGLFGGAAMRWLFFLSGLFGTAMIATGLVLWTAKRRARPSAGQRLVQWLNVGTVAGLPVAIAAYFWANRLIPADIPGRADWEVHILFITWAAMFLLPMTRPARQAWTQALWLAAGGFGMLPLLNAATTDRHLGVTLPARDWVLAGFDLTVLAMGALFALAAWRVGRGATALACPAARAGKAPAGAAGRARGMGHRLQVASRILAASVAGYAWTALLTAVLALAMPNLAGHPRAAAVLAASQWSFAIHAAVVMAVFTARSATHAWIWLAATGAILGACLAALQA